MEISENILEKLKCFCGGYLSSKPVLLNKTDGRNICKNCAPSFEVDEVIENKVYEELASIVLFPCCNKNEGCESKLSFGKIHDHEQDCKYRKYNCPMSIPYNCTWKGRLKNIKSHCEKNHAEQIIYHPCQLEVDIRKKFENYFLVIVYDILFLLQVSCNVAVDKIWYCVRFIGNLKFAKQFNFVVRIGNKIKIENDKIVESFETILLSPNQVLEFSINSIRQICQNVTSSEIMSEIYIKIKNEKCLFCQKNNFDKIDYLDINGYFCSECMVITKCKYSSAGCSYKDVKLNLSKHELLFCKYVKKYCILKYKCLITELTNLEHVLMKHKTIVINYNEICNTKNNRLVNANYSYKVYLLNNIKFIKSYCYSDCVFNCKILCDLPKLETKKYKCRIKLFNKITEYAVEKDMILDLTEDEFDWTVQIFDHENKILYDEIIEYKTCKCYSVQIFIDKMYYLD